MTNTKLITVAFAVLVAVNFCSTVSAQANLASFINAFLPGASSDSQGTSILDPLPQKVKNKIPQDVQNDMQKITVSQLKQDIAPLKQALKKCLSMTSIKDCIAELKKVDPEVTQLLHDIKQHAKNMKPKAMSFLSSLKSMLNNQLLQNLVQTMMNMVQPPAARRRRKRDISVSINVQITSLKQAPMTLQQIKQMIKQMIQKVLNALNAPEPQSPPSLLQQIVNMLSKLSPAIKQFFSNPKVMSMLGTSPPS